MHYQINPSLQENLLAVRGLLHKNYQPYADMLAQEYRPAADWLNRELLPSLILLPTLSAGRDNSGEDSAACKLALAMELSFLAGRVHDLQAEKVGGHSDPDKIQAASRAILIGDYLYTLAAKNLAENGYNQWLERIGRTICRRSESKLARLRWPARPYVPEMEKLANLHKEHAEGMALAAEMSVARLNWSETERQAWIDFGFYVGLTQGILLDKNGFSSSAWAGAASQARQSLNSLSSQLQFAAEKVILNKLAPQREGQREKDEKAAK